LKKRTCLQMLAPHMPVHVGFRHVVSIAPLNFL
jgi:hypothetical protein